MTDNAPAPGPHRLPALILQVGLEAPGGGGGSVDNGYTSSLVVTGIDVVLFTPSSATISAFASYDDYVFWGGTNGPTPDSPVWSYFAWRGELPLPSGTPGPNLTVGFDVSPTVAEQGGATIWGYRTDYGVFVLS